MQVNLVFLVFYLACYKQEKNDKSDQRSSGRLLNISIIDLCVRMESLTKSCNVWVKHP